MTVRFGVLGTGFWAQEIHATSLARHPDAELVGVWGRDLAKAKAVGAHFDVQGYDDLDALLSQVDAAGVPAYLESSNERNVPLYERHGFQVVGEHQALGRGPTIWRMWRDAAAEQPE